jgi:hypothetical protein
MVVFQQVYLGALHTWQVYEPSFTADHSEMWLPQQINAAEVAAQYHVCA